MATEGISFGETFVKFFSAACDVYGGFTCSDLGCDDCVDRRSNLLTLRVCGVERRVSSFHFRAVHERAIFSASRSASDAWGLGTQGLACTMVEDASRDVAGDCVGAVCVPMVSGVSSASAVGGVGESCGGGSNASVDDVAVDVGLGGEVHGKNYVKNKRRRERVKRLRADVRGSGSGFRGLADAVPVPSLSGTVRTVDTRTADEIEAANTLAKRRMAENKLAEIRANRLIASYADVDKTAAIEKLQVVRLEERINTARAKSQASYKKCDESLKSLGSTGSAGEFALKKQIKDTKKLEARLQYVHDQFAAVYPLLSQEAIDRANAVPEPKFPTDFEVFGDCPADYTEEEREAYYLHMNIEAGEIF